MALGYSGCFDPLTAEEISARLEDRTDTECLQILLRLLQIPELQLHHEDGQLTQNGLYIQGCAARLEGKEIK